MAGARKLALPVATQRAAGPGSALRKGTVAAVDAVNGVTVTVGGTPIANLSHLQSYYPRVGDVVSLYAQDSTWLVLGAVTPTSTQWQTLTLQNSWTGTAKARFVWTPQLQVQLAIQATPGTKTDGTTLTTLPTGYAPTTATDLACTASGTVSGGQSPHVNVTAAGAINIFGFTNSANLGLFQFLPLDF